MSFKMPEKYRANAKFHTFLNEINNEHNGIFILPVHQKIRLYIIATSPTERIPWEHVSVSVKNHKGYELHRTPTWDEMCKVKSLFWDPEDVVVQFHPAESDYVSDHHYCLHLWRQPGMNFPTPPPEAVGITKGQNLKT